MTKPPFGRFKIFKTGNTKNRHVPYVDEALIEKVFAATKERSPKDIPLVLGVGGRHPTDGLPILGYADRDSIRLDKEPGKPSTLSIMPKSFAANLREVLKSHGIDKVSIYLPAGEDYIEHIAFLSTPAIELGAAFGADDDDEQGIAFGYGELDEPLARELGLEPRWSIGRRFRSIADWLQRTRDILTADKGADEADRQIPQTVIDTLKADLPDDEPLQPAEGFSAIDKDNDNDKDKDTIMTAEEIAALQARAALVDQLEREAATLKAEKDELERKVAEQEALKTIAEVRAFCDEHATRIGEMRQEIECILLDLKAAQPRAFSADGQTIEISGYAAMRKLIASLPEKVKLGEVATKGEGFGADDDPEKPLSQRADAATADKIAALK